ncbi:MAG: long-chain fatty acid--CoA ligase [Elusimicrobia bacterium]|nr:long-chain fatty acid--CoA ligase [Elusimicrobiota bacterium]
MNLIDLLKTSAEKYPSKTALLFSGKTWTFQELYDSVLKAAAGLRSAGIKEGDKVALLTKNSPEFIITTFALSALGAASVPINFFLKSEEIAFICSNVGACGIVTQSAFLEPVLEAGKKYDGLRQIWVTDLPNGNAQKQPVQPYSSLLEKSPLEKTSSFSEDTTVLFLYTSGTTGKPKGVMLSHKNLISNVLSAVQALELNSQDRFICLLPVFHVFAWTANVLVPIYLGSPITLVEAIRPPKPWLKLVAQQKVTIFAAVPQIYAILAEQARGFKKWVLRYFFFRHVRFCISGSAPLPVEVQEKFEKNFGIPLLEGYGLSETSPVVSVNTLKSRKKGSVGRPVPNVKVKIIAESGKEVPTGEEGEICIQGPNVMQGYYGLPEATKESFTQDGWFKTGDVGILDSDGYIYIRDRIKDMIIVKGLKVFSVQVEDVLLSHPAVLEAAVVGIPNPSGDETVQGFVVLKENQSVQKSELLKLCQEKLPAYKRPRDIEIRKELPKNALQKILKRELRKESTHETG